jgi:hypothetical protein
MPEAIPPPKEQKEPKEPMQTKRKFIDTQSLKKSNSANKDLEEVTQLNATSRPQTATDIFDHALRVSVLQKKSEKMIKS